MTLLYILWSFLLAAAVAAAVTPLAIKIAPKIGAVDIPKDNRRMHSKPMPRFGGVAIFAGTIAAMTLFLRNEPGYVGIICGGTLIYLLGVVDDLKNLSPKLKLLGQFVCASVAYAGGVKILFITNHFAPGHIFFAGALCYIVTVIWIVGITNTVNLIDGLDGLAAGISLIASCAIAYAAYIHGYYPATAAMLAIAGGAAGFLPYNFHPAKIFMGDGGSLFLGYMLATVSTVGSVKGSTFIATVVPFLVLGVPIFDMGFAILRRLINHRPIMEADKGHIHHRLMAAGFGQRRTVLTIYAIGGTMGVSAILLSRDLFMETIGLVGIASILIYVLLSDDTKRNVSISARDLEREERESRKGDRI